MGILETLGLKRDPGAKSESYYCVAPTPVVGMDAVAELKAKLAGGGSTVRICLHADAQATAHNMVVVHKQGGVFRPHKHLTKDESYHMIEGKMRIDLYGNDGRIRETLRLGAPGTGLPFLARIRQGTWHATVPETEFAVFHESRPGPFKDGDSIFPEWS